jgi:hypothetical protein
MIYSRHGEIRKNLPVIRTGISENVPVRRKFSRTVKQQQLN